MKKFVLLLLLGNLVGCSLLFPLKTTLNSYKLDGVSTQRYAAKPHKKSVLVSIPTAAAGYQDNSMLYIENTYKVSPFAKNQWLAPPYKMLQPLLSESLRNSNYFAAVVLAPFTGKTDLRLDTQLLKLQQNFISKPSQIELALQITLVKGVDNTVIATKRFSVVVTAPGDDPYGGVIAANVACTKIMQQVTAFLIKNS